MTPGHLLRNTLVGFTVSLLLALVKLFAGWLGNSTALVADAVESMADAFGSAIVWQGLQWAHRPADSRHPYGYGRAEALAALAVGLLLLMAAGWIVIHAFQQLWTAHAPPAWWALPVLLLVVVVKEWLYRLIVKSAQESASDAAWADAWHHRADAITSLVAVVGVSIAVWGPSVFEVPRLVFADEIAALLASGIVIVTAWRLASPALGELLDRTSPAMAGEIQRAAEKFDGVRLIEKVLARKSGSFWLVEMHLHVPAELDARTAHALAGRVKAGIMKQFPRVRYVLVHVEPDESPIAGGTGSAGATE